MKRIKLFVLVCLLMPVLLYGCGSKSKPDTVIKEFCDSLKNFDFEKASNCFENGKFENEISSEKDELSLRLEEYIKECSKDMKYDIQSTEINEDYAEINVFFEYIDSSSVISEMLSEYISQAFSLALSGANDSILENLTVTILEEKINSVETKKDSCNIVFNCEKTENGWKIKELNKENSDKLFDVISCNIYSTLNSFENNSEVTFSEETEEYVWSDISVGNELELSTIKIKINGSEEINELQKEYIEPISAQEGTKFVVIDVEIENITKSTIDFTNDLVLCDSEGREYTPFSDSIWYFDETFLYTELAPNIRKNGVFVYNVPYSSDNYYLMIAKSGTNEAYRLYAK